MWLCAFLELESVSECLFSYNSDIKKIFFGWPNKESGIVLNVIFVLYIYGQIHWIYKYLYERHKLANQHFLFYFQNCFCNAYCDKIWLWLRPRENFYIQWYKNSEHLVLVNRCTWMSYHKIYLKLINTGINLLVKNWVIGTCNTPCYCYCVSLQHKSRKYLYNSTIKDFSTIRNSSHC